MVTFRSTALAAAFALAVVPALAQSAQDRDANRPGGAASVEGQTTEPTAPRAGMMGPGMMGGNMMGRDMMGGNMMGGNMMGRDMMGSGSMMPMMDMMFQRFGAERIEGRLGFIRAELKITDAQASQWNAFAEAVRANAGSMAEMRQSMMPRQGAAKTLPERLALEEKAVTAHLEALKKTEDAVGKLYGVLSAEQKKVADGIVVGPMGMPMGMM